MSTHDVGHYQHTNRRGYRQGCIMDWLECVAGWGKREYKRPYFTKGPVATRQRINGVITKDWYQIALDWQHDNIGRHGALISCVVAGCDGVV